MMIYDSKEQAIGAFNRYVDQVDELEDAMGIEYCGPCQIDYKLKYRDKDGGVRDFYP
jgi:hypothetical protein